MLRCVKIRETASRFTSSASILSTISAKAHTRRAIVGLGVLFSAHLVFNTGAEVAQQRMGLFVKKELSKVCADCQGSGMVRAMMECPDPAHQQWCSSCELGRAKAEQVAGIVRGTLTEKRPVAA